MMANILRILHPFIPFFTESVWSKNKYKEIFKEDLISSSWPNYKNINKFNIYHTDISNIIELITNIRSTKAELKITPKLFCDLSFSEKPKKIKKLIDNHYNLVKQVGRVKNVIDIKKKSQNSIDIIVLKEKLSLGFSEEVDLSSQKERILQKMESLKKQIDGLNNKLNNKAYIKNAPKEIVQNDKKLIKELTVEDEKLRSIVSSIS